MTQRIPLSIIPEPPPDTRSVVIPGVLPVFLSPDGPDTTHDCGSCSAVLMEKMAPGQVSNIVIKCLECGSYNDTGS